jgi:hypothetical protein
MHFACSSTYTVSEQFTRVMTQQQAQQAPQIRDAAQEQLMNTRMISMTRHEGEQRWQRRNR